MRMILLTLFLFMFIRSEAQQDALYEHRTIADNFKVLEISCSDDRYFTIYIEGLSNGVLYKIVSLRSLDIQTPNVKLQKDQTYHLNLKSYFNFSKKIGDIYYPISSSNYNNCIGFDDDIEICIENKENMDKDVFFVSELKGLYLKCEQ